MKLRAMTRVALRTFALAAIAMIVPVLLAGASTTDRATTDAAPAVVAAAGSSSGVSRVSRSSAPSSPNVENFTFQSMDVVYTLGRADDGTSTLRVEETFVALFPDVDQNRGMRRSVPDEYRFDDRTSWPLFPEFVSITDGTGAPRPSEVDSDDGYFTMTSRADDFVHGEQTYVFTYTLRNVTRFFEDTNADEFYWNVNGIDWRQPFGEVSARIVVDDELAAAFTGAQACYVGYEGSTQTCEIETDAAAGDDTVVAASATDVLPFQTMTVAIAFEPGTFAGFDASPLASPWGWLQGVAGVGVAGSLVYAGVTRRRKLRDEPGRPTIIAEYTPPPGIDALESAVLRGQTSKAIPAEVLEQAVVGSIRIIEGDRKMFGGVKLRAQLVDPSRADRDGIMLLDGLFPGRIIGSEYEFGRTDTRFSKAAQQILKRANSELNRRGLRRKVPGSARVGPVVVAIVAAGLSFLFGVLAMESGVAPAVPIVLLLFGALGVVIVGIMVSRKPLTAKGAEVRDHLEGLKVFIEWAEADRIRMLQSPQGAERTPVDTNDPRQMLKIYEALLPYAVVFGQEKEWAKQLAVLYETTGTPGWYYGTTGFNASAFSSGISNLSASTASSSSTSGGSGGGGSAGSGGGGGGGGGV